MVGAAVVVCVAMQNAATVGDALYKRGNNLRRGSVDAHRGEQWPRAAVKEWERNVGTGTRRVSGKC